MDIPLSKSRVSTQPRPAAITMCYGHPHHHPCGHQSVKWHYCPRAKIDVTTGHATVCNKTTYAISQPSKARCPLKNCYFKELGGVWDCCACKQGPNTQGWCTFSSPSWKKNFKEDEYEWIETCDHGCCKNCTRSEGAGPMPEEDPKKKKKSRKASSGAAAAGSSSLDADTAGEGYGGYGYGGYEYEECEGASGHGGSYGGDSASNSGSRHHGQDGKKSSSSHGKGKGKDKSR